MAKQEVPYLDFSPLQNALEQLKRNTDSLKSIYQDNINGKVTAAFNEALYRGEQQLLNDAGLPRRSWYKHTRYMLLVSIQAME